jgi:predicted esterase
MSKNLLTACLRVSVLLALTIPAFAAGKVQKEQFDFDGKPRTYYFLAPSEEAAVPLVILLHGSGRSGQVMADEWKGLAAREHFIIVAPDAFKADWVMSTDGPNFFHALVQQVMTKHAVDPGRIYLFGHSGGAEYALMLALLESEYFAATAIHAGAMHKENANLFEYAKRKMPINICVGDVDRFYSLEVVKTTKTMFEEKGFTVNIDVIPNHNHDYYAVSTYVNKKAWEFLKVTELKNPNFQEYQTQ